MSSRNASAIYTRANVDITAQLAVLPKVAVDKDTLETLTKISNWIAASTEHAGSLVAELLLQHRGEPEIVASAHDLLGDLTVIRNSALLVELVLSRVQLAETREPAPKA